MTDMGGGLESKLCDPCLECVVGGPSFGIINGWPIPIGSAIGDPNPGGGAGPGKPLPGGMTMPGGGIGIIPGLKAVPNGPAPMLSMASWCTRF
jgi:hypothetical protein